jgi:hypothetical protein
MYVTYMYMFSKYAVFLLFLSYQTKMCMLWFKNTFTLLNFLFVNFFYLIYCQYTILYASYVVLFEMEATMKTLIHCPIDHYK